MIKTLAEKCPAAYEDLKKAGRPCIAEMMTIFARPVGAVCARAKS
jgi:hypothetical protein